MGPRKDGRQPAHPPATSPCSASGGRLVIYSYLSTVRSNGHIEDGRKSNGHIEEWLSTVIYRHVTSCQDGSSLSTLSTPTYGHSYRCPTIALALARLQVVFQPLCTLFFRYLKPWPTELTLARVNSEPDRVEPSRRVFQLKEAVEKACFTCVTHVTVVTDPCKAVTVVILCNGNPISHL